MTALLGQVNVLIGPTMPYLCRPTDPTEAEQHHTDKKATELHLLSH